MSLIKTFTMTLEKSVVEQAKEQLEVGQKLSPVINDLLKKWIRKKKRNNND